MAQWVKESTCNAGDLGDMCLIPGSGRSPGGGHGNPLQYSCLVNSMVRGTWWATVHRVTKSRTQLKQLNMHACTYIYDSLKKLTEFLLVKFLISRHGNLNFTYSYIMKCYSCFFIHLKNTKTGILCAVFAYFL